MSGGLVRREACVDRSVISWDRDPDRDRDRDR
jgi:hypothetical protein